MKKYLLIVLTLAMMLMLFSAVAQAAAPTACTSGHYVYTNDDNFGGSNTVTGFCDTGSGAPAMIGSFPTGGNGQGGGFFGADRLNGVAIYNKALVAGDAGTGDTAGFRINSDGSLTKLFTFSHGMTGDQSIVAFYVAGKTKPCVAIGFANYGVLNSYVGSGSGLTLVSSNSVGTVDGIAIAKTSTGVFIVTANLGGYEYTSINPTTCALGTSNSVGGLGGEAGAAFSADGKMIYFGIANGSTPTMEYGTFPGGGLTQFVASGSAGNNSNVVVVNKTGTCAVLGDNFTPGVTTVKMTAGVPTAFSNDSFDNLGGFYSGNIVWRADETEVFHTDTSGSTNYIVAHGISGCTAGPAAGTNTGVSGPFTLSAAAVPVHTPIP